jgi:uncharacterized protein YdiU (UPF0061 family)
LIEDLFAFLAKERIDYSLFWRRLSHSVQDSNVALVSELFLDRTAFNAWWQRYAQRRSATSARVAAAMMLRTNPKFVLRNHLAELAIQRAKTKDFSGVENLLTVLESPFDEHPDFEEYAAFPPDWARGIEISCSS